MDQPLTITLTRYAEPDSILREVLTAASHQVGVEGEVLFIDQSRDGSVTEDEFKGSPLPVRVLRRAARGLSHARNMGIEEAAHPIVLFLDADAVPEPDWAAELLRALTGEDAAIAGCRILPRWSGTPPLLTRSRVVLDQFSLLDLGSETCRAQKVVGAGFAIDTRRLPPEHRFDEALGRREGRLFGGEETDFCRRAAEAGSTIVYAGRAVVHHVIAPARMRNGWILRRLFYAGAGRAAQGGAPAPSRSPALADYLLLPVILPPYVAGYIAARTGLLR